MLIAQASLHLNLVKVALLQTIAKFANYIIFSTSTIFLTFLCKLIICNKTKRYRTGHKFNRKIDKILIKERNPHKPILRNVFQSEININE